MWPSALDPSEKTRIWRAALKLNPPNCRPTWQEWVRRGLDIDSRPTLKPVDKVCELTERVQREKKASRLADVVDMKRLASGDRDD